MKLEIGIELLESTVEGLNFGGEKLKKMSRLELRSRTMRWDTVRWRNQRESKTTLTVYNLHRREIGGEKVYVNDHGSVLLYMCRSNMLRLDWWEFVGGVLAVRSDGGGVETTQHFLQECDGLRGVQEVGSMGWGTLG